MPRPIVVGEERFGHVVPLNEKKEPAPVDLSKPTEFEVTDPEAAEIFGIEGEPLRFRVKFKQHGVPVDLIGWVDADLGEGMVRVKCMSTYIAEEAPPPPPLPATHGFMVLDE